MPIASTPLSPPSPLPTARVARAAHLARALKEVARPLVVAAAPCSNGGRGICPAQAQDKQERMLGMFSISVKVAILGRGEMLHSADVSLFRRLTWAGDKREESRTVPRCKQCLAGPE